MPESEINEDAITECYRIVYEFQHAGRWSSMELDCYSLNSAITEKAYSEKKPSRRNVRIQTRTVTVTPWVEVVYA